MLLACSRKIAMTRNQLGTGAIFQSDLEEILTKSALELQQLSSAKILIFGGTGFVGKWLVSSLLEGCKKYDLNLDISLVTRNPQATYEYFGDSNRGRLTILQHDLALMEPEILGDYDYYIHGATSSIPSRGSLELNKVRAASINCANAIVAAAKKSKSKPKVLNLSSGAVKGNNRTNDGRVAEDGTFGAPLNEYAATKIEVEKIFNLASSNDILDVINARLFAFAGPYISLDDHFAVGNFLKNALLGGPILVRGNPQTVRSYLYPSDLAVCLIKSMVLINEPVINIGSPIGLTMEKIAENISKTFGNIPIEFTKEFSEQSSYVPVTDIMSSRLTGNLIDLSESLSRWAGWVKVYSEII